MAGAVVVLTGTMALAIPLDKAASAGMPGAAPAHAPFRPVADDGAHDRADAGLAGTAAGRRAALAARIAADMAGAHEERPHGVPDDYSWARGPRVNLGNRCPADWTSMMPWGQTYEAASGNPATNTRVHVKDLTTWYLSKKDRKWRVWQSSRDVEGAMYVEDYVSDVSRTGPEYVRDEPGGGQSAIPGDGFNFHFWTPKRSRVDCADIAGVVSVLRARLVVDDPAGPDDRARARFVMSVGADYWRSQTARWAPDFVNNDDIGIGKFRYVTPTFSSYYMTTMTREQLAKNPPPL
ncbi:MAG: hypothetical protein ACRCYR_15290 [Phycicoccus sp.]